MRRSDEDRGYATEISRIQEQAEGSSVRLRRLGIPPEDPVGPINGFFNRLNIASALLALYGECDRIAFSVPDLPEGILSEDTPLNDLSQQVAARFDETKRFADQQLEDLAEQHGLAARAQQQLQNDTAVLQQSLTNNRNELASLRQRLDRLQKLWSEAAPGLDWTEASLARIRSDVSDKQENTKRALLSSLRRKWHGRQNYVATGS